MHIRKGSDHDTRAMQRKIQDIAGIIQMILPNYHFYEVIDISKVSQYNYSYMQVAWLSLAGGEFMCRLNKQ